MGRQLKKSQRSETSWSPKQLAKLTLLLLARRVQADLETESDREKALRKALLMLVALSQETQSTASKGFSQYILTEFQPLRSHLTHFDHEIWNGEKISVRANPKGEPVVAIDRRTVEALIESFAHEDRRTQREVVRQIGDDSASETPWLTTTERYVGLFDIMGFTAMVREAGNNHDNVYSVMQGLHDAAQVAERFASKGDHLSQLLSSSGAPSGQLRAAQLSDSIWVFTQDASPAASLLIQIAAQILFLHALRHRVILRGAIAKGVVTADFPNSIFFGGPILEAIRLEKEQQWYGIAIDQSAEDRETADASELKPGFATVTERFDVYLQGHANPEQLSVVNWPVFANSLNELEELLRPFDGKRSKEPEKLAVYHARTLAFAQSMWKKYRTKSRRA